MHHAIVNANTSIGDNCIINSKALIEHDCSISNHCQDYGRDELPCEHSHLLSK